MQVKGENDAINVKRLPKKKAPPRFGRKLTASQKENATHICAGAFSCPQHFFGATGGMVGSVGSPHVAYESYCMLLRPHSGFEGLRWVRRSEAEGRIGIWAVQLFLMQTQGFHR